MRLVILSVDNFAKALSGLCLSSWMKEWTVGLVLVDNNGISAKAALNEI